MTKPAVVQDKAIESLFENPFNNDLSQNKFMGTLG